MQRESIIRGPAIVSWNSLVWYSEGDIKLTLDRQATDIGASAFGRVARRVKSRVARISFTPAGKWVTGLWPYAATAIGASIYGSTDRDLTIKPLNTSNSEYVLYNAAITKLPSIHLGTTKTLIGEVELTALGKENTLPSVADSLIKVQTNTFNDTSFSPGDLVTQPYAAAWGSVLTGIETVSGWDITFDLGLKPVESDTYGIIDMTLSSLGVTAKCDPLTITEAQLISALAIDASMGSSLNAGNDLAITGTGVSVTVKNAVIESAGAQFGAEVNRLGTLEWVAAKKFTTGAADPLYAVA